MQEAEPVHGLVRHLKATRIWNFGITLGTPRVDPFHKIVPPPLALRVIFNQLRFTEVEKLRAGASGGVRSASGAGNHIPRDKQNMTPSAAGRNFTCPRQRMFRDDSVDPS